MKCTKVCCFWLASWLLLSPLSTMAATSDQQEIMVNISGLVTATGSCSFNGNDIPAIDFGVVGYKKIAENTFALDGSYKRVLPVSLTCQGDTAGANLIFTTPFGNVVHAGRNLMSVNDGDGGNHFPDLAIGFRVNGVEQNVENFIAVDLTSPLTLEAELVQIGSGASFVSGKTFKTTVILSIDFH